MFEIIKMMVGCLFSATLMGYVINKKMRGWKIAALVFGIATILFLGQFVSLLGS